MKALSGVALRRLASGPRRICAAGQIDVWLLSTRVTAADQDVYDGVLSPDERRRAQGYVRDADRLRSIVGRGGLRWILSQYTGTPPGDLDFARTPYGKPFLSAPATGPAFNLSHSGDHVLFGVTAGSPCGVDVEQVRAMPDAESIAERSFCPREIAWLKRPGSSFLRLWAAKEAVVKALGQGLSLDLTAVDVTDVVSKGASRPSFGPHLSNQGEIWLRELDLGSGYAAAVAVLGPQHVLRLCPQA